MFYKTVIFEQNYQTAGIHSLKEPRVVAMESFLIEFIEAIVHKNFKTKCF